MNNGGVIQQIAPILFGVEIGLYVVLVLAGLAGLVVFWARLQTIRKAKGDPGLWMGLLVQDLDSGVLPTEMPAVVETDTLPGRVVHAGVKNAGLSPEALEKVFEVQESAEKRALERGVSYLGTLGANAPFVGLTGTVLGILIAFNEFAQSGGQGSSAVMVAIARSLVATTMGLLVAIPAVIAFNVLKSQIKETLEKGREIRGLILARALHASVKEN
jgi:biopolymer transport protein ExbB